ncbi:unnamed protein product [Chilo suppressalis]|uniref:Uncharacterized protein n=1 Tax=Chilo suppressalis TaxID=168631 RepID=A0ABN8BIH4_CHISP|nr:unnamed protein product [Chilo suppressalis]
MAKGKSREEDLERKRVARRERYKKLKANPERYSIEQQKKREAYLKRKIQNKVKSIKDMSPREQKVQRRRWKESSKRYLEKKIKERQINEINIDDSPAAENSKGTVDSLSDPLKECTIKTDNKKGTQYYKNKIKLLKLKHLKEKKELSFLIKKYKNRCGILNRVNKILSQKLKNKKDNINDDNHLELPAPSPHSDCDKEAVQAKTKNIIKTKEKNNLDLRKKCLNDRFLKEINKSGGDIQKLVKEYYEDDINSRIGAGKKQCVKKYGIQKQKRYMLDSIKNLHKKFLEENPLIKISYVTFSRLRPFWVYLPRDDRDTCACTTHTNIDLIIHALRKNKIIDLRNYQEMLGVLCCTKFSAKCVARECDVCKNESIAYKEFDNQEEIEYYEWVRDKKKVGAKDINVVKKVSQKINPRNLIQKLESSLPKFFVHTGNILNQYQAITMIKQSLSPNETLLHMDFSENYCYKFAKEIQSLHFGGSRGQVSLHTVVAYLKEGRDNAHYSFCTVSECTRHDAPAVWAHLENALKFVFEKCSSVTTVHILTDSPTSQYRNKQIFYIITQLHNTFPSLKCVTWNFQESGHGKGAPDGIGAVVKRSADYQVKCGNDVGDFTKFLAVVKENVKNVEIRVVNEADIIEKEIMLPKDISPFKGTMSVHQVLWNIHSDFLEFRKLSCFLCIEEICHHDNKHMQLHKIYKSAIASSVENVKIVPASKQIHVLEDITLQFNESPKPSTSGLRQIRKNQNVVTLAKYKCSYSSHKHLPPPEFETGTCRVGHTMKPGVQTYWSSDHGGRHNIKKSIFEYESHENTQEFRKFSAPKSGAVNITKNCHINPAALKNARSTNKR